MPAWTVGRLLMLGSAIALAACAGRQPPAAPPDAAASVPGAAWTVSDRGYGPVRIGMTTEEASGAFGRPLLPLNPNAEAACSYVFPDGDVDAEIAFMVAYGRIVRVDVDTAGIATDAGAEVGDSETSALALYADAEVQPHKYGDADDHYLAIVAPDGTHALILETWDGTISDIRAGKLPEAAYVEGCS